MTSSQNQKPPIQKVRAIFLDNGKVLVVSSTRKQGFFALPGGHVEEGEQHVVALIRELREELSVQVREYHVQWLGTFALRAPKDGGKIITDLYFVGTYQGILKPSGNVTSMQWVALDDLLALNPRSHGGMFRHVVPALRKKGLLTA